MLLLKLLPDPPDRMECGAQEEGPLQQEYHQSGCPRARVAETPTRARTPFWDRDDAPGSSRQHNDLLLLNHTVVSGGGFGDVVVVVSAWQLPGTVLAGSQQRFSAALCQPLGTASSAPKSSSGWPPPLPPPGPRLCAAREGADEIDAEVLIVLMKMANTHPFHLAAQRRGCWGCNYPLQERVKYLSGLAIKLISPDY